jgi:long-chain acyl-CoA synthetase
MELFRPSLNYPSYPYDEMLIRTAERFPENVAVISKEVNLTYRELDALTNSFANALLEQGVSKGQKVGLFMTNRAEYLISWFAVARIGADISPLNPSYKEREVAYQLGNCEAVAIVVQQEFLPLIEAVRSELLSLKLVITVGSDKLTATSHVLAFDQLLRDYPPLLSQRPEIGWEDVVTLT